MSIPDPLPSHYQRWSSETFGGPSTLKLSTHPMPTPGKNEILLKVLATDATYTDLIILSGFYREKITKILPISPGYECSALVASIGPGVDASFKINDAVLAMPLCGCASEYLIVNVNCVVHLKDEASMEYVKTNPIDTTTLALTGVTAYQMLYRVMGEKRIGMAKEGKGGIVVHGAAGGTGAMLVQLAKIAGIPPSSIYGTCSSKNKDAVEALGATAISYEGEWASDIKAKAGKSGVIALFDSITSKAYYNKAVGLIKRGGVYCSIGFTSKLAPGRLALSAILPIMTNIFFRHNVLRLFGGADSVFFIISDSIVANKANYDTDVKELVRLCVSGELEIVKGKVWDFNEEVSALQSIASGKHKGKQCIRVAVE